MKMNNNEMKMNKIIIMKKWNNEKIIMNNE